MVLINAKALTPEEATAKIATIQQIIVAINALSKVTFFNDFSLGSEVFISSLHFFHYWAIVFLKTFYPQNVILWSMVSVISQLFLPMSCRFLNSTLPSFLSIKNSDNFLSPFCNPGVQ